MIKKIYLFFLILIPLVQGCQKPVVCNNNDEVLVTEMNPELQSNEFHNESNYLLTEEEARQALLEMIAKREARSKALAKIDKEKNEAILKIWEENERNEKELLEMAEYDEDVEQSLQKLRDETNEQMRKISSHYSGKYASVESSNTQFRDMEDGDVEYDKLFEDYVVITITQTNYPERDGSWECDLKTGWFRKSTRTQYFPNTMTGRFRKDKNGEWTAGVVAWSF